MALTQKQRDELVYEIKKQNPRLKPYFIDLLVSYYETHGNDGLKKLMHEDMKQQAKQQKQTKHKSNEPIIIYGVEKADHIPFEPNVCEVVECNLGEHKE